MSDPGAGRSHGSPGDRPLRSVLVVGESIAGVTAARELRAHGFGGEITILGDDPDGPYARPPLSKDVLKPAGPSGQGCDITTAASAGVAYSLEGLDVTSLRSGAVSLDAAERRVATGCGRTLSYDALLIATGAAPRRLAAPGQGGELVVRTLADARELSSRLDHASRAVVVGAGFLGMEVASACVARGVSVAVVDVAPPLERVLGTYLAEAVARRADDHGVDLVLADGPVELVGSPIRAVRVPGRAKVLEADLVISCAGDEPSTGWLAGSGLAGPAGVLVDSSCRTDRPGVYAAGDVAIVRGSSGAGVRAPFWSNAVAQAKVAAAAMLGKEAPCAPHDEYFWTEVLGLAIKVVGSLPLDGAPEVVAGDLDAGALLRWSRPDGRATVVAYGRKIPVGRLRSLAAGG